MPKGVYKHPIGWKHKESSKIKTRKKLMGHPGAKHPYKEKVSYSGCHYRVYSAKGKANYCASCGLNSPSGKYYWANLTGNYHDLNDYMSMCMSCHIKYDFQRRVKSGKKTSCL